MKRFNFVPEPIQGKRMPVNAVKFSKKSAVQKIVKNLSSKANQP